MLGTIDSGTAAIVVALVAAIPGGLAFFASRRKDDGEVSVQRDDASWKRMEASVARTDSDLAALRAEFVAQGIALADATEHGRRCDAALAEEIEHRQRLEVEVAELRTRVDRGTS